MGISDDIRPKKNKIKDHEPEEETPEVIENEEGELVSINHGDNHDFVDEDIEEQLENEKKQNEQNDLSEYFYKSKENTKVKTPRDHDKKGGVGKWIIVLLILTLMVIIVWQNLDSIKSYLGISKTGSSENSNSSNPYSGFSVTDTNNTSTAATPTTATPATTETPAAATTTAPLKSSYLISVLNGNGVKGSAAIVKNTLTNAGYTVSNTGNALKFTYVDTIIYYKTGKDTVANDLKTVLSDRTCELLLDNTIAGNYDIVVVVGKT